jgi:LacI family transcriptional regulator, galactose operon repressor
LPASAASPQRVTLTAVARAVGVSPATVSKVINGRSDVSPETRARIQAALLEHDYVARGLGGVPQVTRSLDLVFDALESPNNLEIIRGVTEAASEASVAVVVGVIPDDPLGATWSRRVATAQREGVILVTSTLSPQQRRHFAQTDVPLVLIDPVNVPDGSLPSIGATNFGGGMDAATHLTELGHRRIGMICGKADAVCGVARLHGYHAALAAVGIAPDPDLVRPGDFTYESGYRAGLELLALPDPPTAIFAANDPEALGVVEAARVRGLRVPEDLSIVGFDDMPPSRWASPPLTTVRQPFAEMGRAAAHTLLQLAAGETLNSTRVELATTLVVRESTAPPRTAAPSS